MLRYKSIVPDEESIKKREQSELIRDFTLILLLHNATLQAHGLVRLLCNAALQAHGPN